MSRRQSQMHQPAMLRQKSSRSRSIDRREHTARGPTLQSSSTAINMPQPKMKKSPSKASAAGASNKGASKAPEKKSSQRGRKAIEDEKYFNQSLLKIQQYEAQLLDKSMEAEH